MCAWVASAIKGCRAQFVRTGAQRIFCKWLWAGGLGVKYLFGGGWGGGFDKVPLGLICHPAKRQRPRRMLDDDSHAGFIKVCSFRHGNALHGWIARLGNKHRQIVPLRRLSPNHHVLSLDLSRPLVVRKIDIHAGPGQKWSCHAILGNAAPRVVRPRRLRRSRNRGFR